MKTNNRVGLTNNHKWHVELWITIKTTTENNQEPGRTCFSCCVKLLKNSVNSMTWTQTARLAAPQKTIGIKSTILQHYHSPIKSKISNVLFENSYSSIINQFAGSKWWQSLESSNEFQWNVIMARQHGSDEWIKANHQIFVKISMKQASYEAIQFESN